MNGHIKLGFDVVGADVETLEGFFLMNAVLTGAEEKNDGTRVFYLARDEWTDAMQESLTEFIRANPGIEFLGAEEILERDWNAEWEASILPQRATRELVITPSWNIDAARAMGAEYMIVIDPKMSFGTGHHETTRLCLGAIEAMDVSGARVLDLGTGTGVLAMYTLLRGAKSAVGIDTDHWAIENAMENRALNGISVDRFEVRMGMLEAVAKPGEQFDIVLANLHRNVLIESRDELWRHSQSGARVVISGILVYDVPDVREAYKSKGFQFINEWRENEWACLLFERG